MTTPDRAAYIFALDSIDKLSAINADLVAALEWALTLADGFEPCDFDDDARARFDLGMQQARAALSAATGEDLEEEPPIDPDLIDRMNRSGIVCGNCGCDLHLDGTCPEGCTNDETTGESGPYSADEGEESVR